MTESPSAAGGTQSHEGAFWREAIAPYEQPHLGRSTLDIMTSLVPYLALWAAMYLALDVSYWLVLALSLPAAGVLLPHFRSGRSTLDIMTSLVPYLALWAAMYLALDVSYWLVLALSVPAAGFLLRTF